MLLSCQCAYKKSHPFLWVAPVVFYAILLIKFPADPQSRSALYHKVIEGADNDDHKGSHCVVMFHFIKLSGKNFHYYTYKPHTVNKGSYSVI